MRERWSRVFLGGATVISSLALGGILVFLVYFSLPILKSGGIGELLAWTWQPLEGRYGILPMVAGSLCLATSALLLAYPLALGICGFIDMEGGRRPARLLVAVVHFMTGIPTVVWGFVSVFLMVPLLREVFSQGSGFSWLAAGVTLCLLILPTVVLIMRSQLDAVDLRVRLAAAASGLTPSQTFLHVMLPAASRGLLGAGILGFARALGDTLVALMVSGNAAQMPRSLLESIRTLTAHIAIVVATDSTSPSYHSIFACGLILFIISALATVCVRRTVSGGTARGSHVWRS